MVILRGMNRRYFLGSALSAGVAVRSHALASPNDTVRVACVGVRGRGRSHISAYSKMPNVEIAAICDVDESVLNARLGEIEKAKGKRPAGFTDLRKLLEDKSIDAISIATPNHQHTLQTIWACQAGKDVYVEKPCSHNMFEAKQIVATARKYNRMVQQGSQSRSSVALREAVQKMNEGLIGDVYLARGLCYKWRNTIGKTPVSDVPAGVDYDLWLGPAPKTAFTKNHFHYNWHWFWAYGNGDLGNQGIHEVDIARWGLGVKYPTKASAIGGKFMFDDDQETPNTLNCAFEFDEPDGHRKMMEFDVRHWITNNEAGLGHGLFNRHNAIGNIFYGANGYLAGGNEDGFSYESWLGSDQHAGPRGKSGSDHFANFITCVRSRKTEELNAPIQEGHISCALVHLANASYRLGRALRFDPETEQVVGDDEATRLLSDAGRGYRAPFIVPDEV